MTDKKRAEQKNKEVPVDTEKLKSSGKVMSIFSQDIHGAKTGLLKVTEDPSTPPLVTNLISEFETRLTSDISPFFYYLVIDDEYPMGIIQIISFSTLLDNSSVRQWILSVGSIKKTIEVEFLQELIGEFSDEHEGRSRIGYHLNSDAYNFLLSQLHFTFGGNSEKVEKYLKVITDNLKEAQKKLYLEDIKIQNK